MYRDTKASSSYEIIPPGSAALDGLYQAVIQGIDGSARKPALRKDTGYMVEKTYTDIPPYLGAFGA